jgi:RecA-family ATPase
VKFTFVESEDNDRDPGAALTPLTFCDIDKWSRSEPPPRDWAVPDRFPLRNVALLSGEGAVGKSILLMQLAAAHVLARDWLGTLPKPGPAIYLNAEDEEAELHRRLVDIAAHFGAPLAKLKDNLHILALAGQDAVLGYADRDRRIKSTLLFERLTKTACDIRPKLIALDTSADIFAGNENDRSEVRQFIGLMRGMAMTANAAVIIATHPSLTGISSGSGLSGNTAWHNSVRARAYMKSVKVEGGTEPDKALRQLEFMKSNYGPVAETITVRWKDGVFVPEPKTGSLEKYAADARADEVFLKLLERFGRQGRIVGDKRGPSFAPALFAQEPEAKVAGLTNRALAEAMLRLFAVNKIHVETYGRPSRLAAKIVAGPPPQPPEPEH